MKTHILQRTQFIPGDLTGVWNFFSTPHNLKKITPQEMGFKIVGNRTEAPIYEGMEINYLVKPIFSIPMQWTTLITEVSPFKSFTDKQIKGPYALWEHSHTFTAVNDGVSMVDTVRYALPYGFLGNIAHWALLERRLNYIFDYRATQIEHFFRIQK